MIITTLRDAIDNIWPMLVIFMVVLISIRVAYMRGSKKDFVFYKEVMNLIFILYLLLLFELVTNTGSDPGGLNLIPFTEMFRHSLNSELFFYNVVGNILVFLPFGYFVAGYVKSKSVGQMFILSFIASLTIELIQYKIGRTFDIDDIILNIAGGILGFLIFIGLSAVKKHLPELFQRDFIYNVMVTVLLVLIVLYYFGIYKFGW